MHSKIAETLALKQSPVAILLTDTKPEKATQFKEGSMGCTGAMMRSAAKGRVVVFDRKTSGCPGGGTGLGFGNCYTGFPINRLLSTGGKAELPNGYTFDMKEGERFFESPEVTDRWLIALPYRDVPTEFIVFKPLDQVAEGEDVSLVLMFVNPDQLSALITLAGFRRGSINATVSPWGAACQSILFAYAEAQRETPRGVIGFFDISQRGKLEKELLSYTMPYRLFLEMESSVDDSFLKTHMWDELRERW
ncbi:MAG TPA: DUF169 domain-containing protein [bacterium]|nr:DUF169 domain-containing protein [bacterium]